MTMATKKIINLALQGGGAHGAFTWGALDALLEDERIDFKTISGTSAGAMNAAVMVSGMLAGGPAKAREYLATFWRRVSQSGRFGVFTDPAMEKLWAPLAAQFGSMASSASYMGFDYLSRMFSPYQFNPLAINPLRDILTDLVDFEALKKSKNYHLHISATDVMESRLRIFTGDEITVDALLASACLPQLFQAVAINGHYYWDGGYMGNPSLYPLTNCTASRDILVVQIDPIVAKKVPHSADEIADRLNEISFNASLLIELKGLNLVNKLIQRGHLDQGRAGLRQFHLHMVGDEDTMGSLTLESKFNPEWGFLSRLRDAGHTATRRWLAANFESIGIKSTLDVDALTA